MNTNQIATISDVVTRFAHLCPRGATLTFQKFAAKVIAESPDAAALLLATKGKIRRGLFGGLSAMWEA